ncbi:(2Fe-2S)-binding protein [Aestuariicella hydrocarbonica]|uniref:(2Fe-2S)-binding protein n=1 Tax=Pseudomaricurvus hydrocarbonicus TaxID=1470433 RepID=A0A9E5JW58_9GAMM|nr:(2Fe-2S)-binding protein [Aestuariicella hydrocarbonica]NHO65681.1 (2Fe-2S)-binding protein [Aestuariicella hydrocarbonica]
MSKHTIELTINGRRHSSDVEARTSLADFLRDDAGYTGVHLGCEHGVCGACTVIVDGKAVRSCLMLAVQTHGSDITTVEGLAADDGTLHTVQQTLQDEHGLQCGFCTPGIVMTMAALTDESYRSQANPTEEQLLGALSGHICRCTGYQGIRRAAKKLANPVEIYSGDES